MTAPWKDPVELFELVFGSLLIFGAFVRPEFASRTLRAAESQVNRLAARRWISTVFVGILGLGGSAGVSFLTRIPEPAIHDEFAHLLAADTFASGRLSNPTHPMWIHFESFNVNQKPTYASKYPPAQGLILALGQVISGLPIAGVWLSSGLACGAICWMLQGWFRPGAALLGGILAAFQIGILSYWTQSYWGGMMAALGSALIFGGMRRILPRPRVGASVALGFGLAILANSRPFEGLLSSLPVFILLGIGYFGRPTPERRAMLHRIVMPICAIGFITLMAMGYYNLRQTGNPLITAYQVNTATYQVQPIFRWGQFRDPPVYNHAVMRKFYDQNLTAVQLESLIHAKAPTIPHHLLNLWQFYGGVLLALPFLLGATATSPFIWSAQATVVTVCGGLLLSSPWISPHYASPMTGPFFIVVTHGWQRLRTYQFRRRRTGLALARGIVVLSVAMLCLRVLAAHLQMGSAAGEWPYQRAAIERELKQTGGSHLILVRYGENHNPGEEWVYNGANIDRQPVVWGREMDPDHNRTLIAYFHTRSVWLLEPDAPARKLVPYPSLSVYKPTGVAALR